MGVYKTEIHQEYPTRRILDNLNASKHAHCQTNKFTLIKQWVIIVFNIKFGSLVRFLLIFVHNFYSAFMTSLTELIYKI